MSVRSSSTRRRARSSGSPPAMGSSVASTVSLPRFDPDAGSTAWSVSTSSARSDSSSTPGVASRDTSPDVVTFGSSVGALVDDHESSGSENDSSWSCLMGSAGSAPGSVVSGAFSPATRAAASRSASVMDGTVPSSAGASEVSGVPQVQVNSSVEASAFAVSGRVDGDEDASSRLSTTNTRGSSDDDGSVVTSSPSPGTDVGDS